MSKASVALIFFASFLVFRQEMKSGLGEAPKKTFRTLLVLNTKNYPMQERIIRAIAGSLVLLSIVLAVLVNINWLYLAGFVALNLLQSSITKWCLMNDILTKLGVPK